MSHIPTSVIKELRVMAIDAIREYAEAIHIGTSTNGGDAERDHMTPLLIMASESFMVVATWAALNEGRTEEQVQEMMEELGKTLPEYAMMAVKLALKEHPEKKPKDPLDIVDDIIEKMKK